MSTTTKKRLTQAEIDRLMRRTQVLASGISKMWGTYLTPSDKWAANIKTGEIQYDLGLAALLDERAQSGVALHEIAHLRYTRAFKPPPRFKGTGARFAGYLVNLFEDCRIENELREEFPGTVESLDRLRDAWRNPDVIKAMAMAEPYMQFNNAMYCVIFGLPAMATDARVQGLVQSFADEALELVEVGGSTKKLGQALCREDGIVDAMLELYEDGVRQQQPPTPVVEPEDEDEDGWDPGRMEVDGGEGEDEDGEEGTAGETLGENEESAEVGDEDGEDEPTGDMTVPDPLDYDGEDDVAADVNANADVGANPGGTGGLSEQDLGAMTPEQRQMLSDAMGQVATDDELPLPERERARKISEALTGTRQKVNDLNRQAGALMRSRMTHEDDVKYRLLDRADVDAYWNAVDKIRDDASVLGRNLGSVLEENRTDRWSSISHETGKRINVPALARASGTGRRDVFRRQTRAKNRKYAIPLLIDVSSSMTNGDRIGHAQLATVMMAQSLRQLPGVEFAVYSFGNASAALKPFDMDMQRREGLVGMMRKLPTDGSLGMFTYMAAAIQRAGGETLSRYDDSWRKLMIVVTDGVPTDDPAPVVHELYRKHDVDVVGIGINTPGNMARIFPTYVVIEEAYDLPIALTRVLRRKVRKG